MRRYLYLTLALLAFLFLAGCGGGNSGGEEPSGNKRYVYFNVTPNPVYVQRDPTAPKPMITLTWSIQGATYWTCNFSGVDGIPEVGSTARAWMYRGGSYTYYVQASNEYGITRAEVTVQGVYLPY